MNRRDLLRLGVLGGPAALLGWRLPLDLTTVKSGFGLGMGLESNRILDVHDGSAAQDTR